MTQISIIKIPTTIPNNNTLFSYLNDSEEEEEKKKEIVFTVESKYLDQRGYTTRKSSKSSDVTASNPLIVIEIID